MGNPCLANLLHSGPQIDVGIALERKASFFSRSYLSFLYRGSMHNLAGTLGKGGLVNVLRVTPCGNLRVPEWGALHLFSVVR